MIPMTLCFAAMTWTFLTALVNGSPANTVWLQYFAPAWVVLASVVIFRERPLARDWFMLATCLTGVFFILVMDAIYSVPSEHHRWWAPVLAVLSGVFYAGVILGMRVLQTHDSAWLAALNHIVIVLVMAPIVVDRGYFHTVWLDVASFGKLRHPSNGASLLFVCSGTEIDSQSYRIGDHFA